MCPFNLSLSDAIGLATTYDFSANYYGNLVLVPAAFELGTLTYSGSEASWAAARAYRMLECARSVSTN